MRTAVAVSALLFLLAPAASAGDPPFPAGLTEQEHAGMTYYLVMPPSFDPAKEYSLLIGLHGMGGDAKGVASGFSDLARDGFVVCAPKSGAGGWDQPNVEKTKEVLAHLLKVLPIGDGKLHGAAFSQGSGFLASLVFDRRFRFVSACWSMGGCSGGKVPPRAKEEMGVIAMVGGDDWARGAAEGSVKMLSKKVRTVECHVQPGIGHEFPSALVGYYRAWLEVMDGRYVPGECPTFTWEDDPESAKAAMAGEKKGALLYVYSTAEDESGETRRVQNEVLFDPFVRHYGGQAVALRLDAGEHADLLKALGIEETPAVAVLEPDFTVSKAFTGKKLTASALAKALRGVAKNKQPPEKPGVFIHGQ